MGATGAVVLTANDRYLVASAVVRAALGELARGNATAGDALLCDAVRAGTLWSSAGFAGRAGSFSADDVSWSVETTLWPTDGTSCDDDDGDPAEYNFADCDGAPCDLAAAFDAEYDATCACPVRATRYALRREPRAPHRDLVRRGRGRAVRGAGLVPDERAHHAHVARCPPPPALLTARTRPPIRCAVAPRDSRLRGRATCHIGVIRPPRGRDDCGPPSAGWRALRERAGLVPLRSAHRALVERAGAHVGLVVGDVEQHERRLALGVRRQLAELAHARDDGRVARVGQQGPGRARAPRRRAASSASASSAGAPRRAAGG